MSKNDELELQEVALSTLGDLVPAEVLYEFEWPCIFVTRGPSTLLLMYLVEDLQEEKRLRYFAVPTCTEMITKLKTGLLTVREALLQDYMWLVEVDYEGKPACVKLIKSILLPETMLPKRGTLLWASLNPKPSV